MSFTDKKASETDKKKNIFFLVEFIAKGNGSFLIKRRKNDSLPMIIGFETVSLQINIAKFCEEPVSAAIFLFGKSKFKRDDHWYS